MGSKYPNNIYLHFENKITVQHGRRQWMKLQHYKKCVVHGSTHSELCFLAPVFSRKMSVTWGMIVFKPIHRLGHPVNDLWVLLCRNTFAGSACHKNMLNVEIEITGHNSSVPATLPVDQASGCVCSVAVFTEILLWSPRKLTPYHITKIFIGTELPKKNSFLEYSVTIRTASLCGGLVLHDDDTLNNHVWYCVTPAHWTLRFGAVWPLHIEQSSLQPVFLM